MPARPGRTPVLYLAPWVDFGGTDKGTIDWFRWLDRSRWAPSLITTQPSPNRRLAEVVPYAEEVWPLPELMAGQDFPPFIADFIQSRGVEVVHVMNSRLGFDLLPDLRALPRPPKLVVQLHVEEPERSGYVRYVTTRYGSLVDAFSVTSHHLAEAVRGYGISSEQVEVIHTGVDAEEEFSPERVAPIAGLGHDRVNVLYPGRLVEQKDPLLMVEVAAALRRRRADFVVHAVGDGSLEDAVRARLAELDLDGHVRLHPPTPELARWYAACDLLLLTSVFEGVPYVVFEALAMGVPAIVPALPGNRELLAEGGGVLIDPRDDPEAYAAALERLIADPGELRRLGAEGRQRVRAEFSLGRMADAHEALYERLLAGNARPPTPTPPASSSRDPLRLSRRPGRARPLVSVVVPCFNHGRWLAECLQSVRDQDYADLETIVVDDASTEAATRAVLDELEGAPDVRLLRLERNSGPSAARNRAVELARGRYVLPLDADNLLLPHAVETLVRQLQGAGERIGYVFQNLQYFGNREDYFEAPEFNLYTLTNLNFADTAALIDREVFDAGVRYPEDVVHGHEDWDFYLALAERGVHGQPAHAKTLLYRKVGFTRSDTVEYAATGFQDELAERHPALYGTAPERAAHRGPALAIKARWAPALSVLALTPVSTRGDAWRRLAERLAAQHCRDLEVLSRCDGDPVVADDCPPVRRVPARDGDPSSQVVVEGLARARGRVVLVARGTGAEVLEDPGSAERLLRLFATGEGTRYIAFAGAEGPTRFPFGLLDGEDEVPHAVAWALDDDGDWPRPAELRPGRELEALVEAARTAGRPVEWRHLPGPPPPSPDEAEPEQPAWSVPRLPSERLERKLRFSLPVALPTRAAGAMRRSDRLPSWMPVASQPLVRHRETGGEGRIVTNTVEAPAGYEHEYVLGSVHLHSPPGTRRLVGNPREGYETLPTGGEPDADELDRSLGYLEQVPFPLLDALVVCRHPGTGEQVLMCRQEDPLEGAVESPTAILGWVESLPLNPRRPPAAFAPAAGRASKPAATAGLVRAVDLVARRHVYALGRVPAGVGASELGALAVAEPEAGLGLWIDLDGRVRTELYVPEAARPRPATAARWVGAPLSWRGEFPLAPRLRATARRGYDLTRLGRRAAGRSERSPDTPSAWLWRDAGPGRVELLSGLHPVTGDQLVTRHPIEAADLGYADLTPLGYVLAEAPVTGTLDRPPVALPWASRFGQVIRWELDGV